MLSVRARGFVAMQRPPLACGGAGAVGLGERMTISAGASQLLEQKRFSFKYAAKSQHNEMRQPDYIHDKRYGLFSNEHNVGKARRGLPFVTPLYTKHMNLWETDTDASSNRFFRSYVFGQRELHLLLGRPHGFEADGVAGRAGDSDYEQSTDMRYKGLATPAIANLHYEPEWNYTLYRNSPTLPSLLSNPRSPFTEEILGPELVAVRDVKSAEHCKAWFDRLQYLIQLHYDAVGDVGPFKSRHTQHVHEFFVAFHDALSSFDFQDAYLYEQFSKVRPKALEDVFAIFLEMEDNYVHEEYCPRCSLPYATTRYCGEGDPSTPHRKHRGRWAPHQHWGKEWYDVVMRRAEALWYRATEDPYFGTTGHTQRQVEAMLRVYIKTKHRAKAIDFMNQIRGSKEFLLGQIRITDAMQHALDHLLDTTAHQHLLTNAFTLEAHAAIYTGDANKVPLSPLQLRVDLERNRFRRMQREEGVVRVPPASWKIDTASIVPYKLDKDKHVVNWREVKEGIEKSFLSTGLPKEAYTSQEWREMLYWKDLIAHRGARRAELETQRLEEEHRAGANAAMVVFPDKSWYRVFDTSEAALKPFNVGVSGTVFTASAPSYPDASAVPYAHPISGQQLVFNTTAEACKPFGDLESGDVLRLGARGKGSSGSAAQEEEVVVVGVNVSGAESEWALYGMFTDPAAHAEKGLVELAKDCLDLRDRFSNVTVTGRKAVVTALESQRTMREEFLAQVVGVRDRQLYVQWRLVQSSKLPGDTSLDRTVAVPLGSSAVVQSAHYQFKPLHTERLVEPPSWHTPFRNEFAEERLKELEQAPFTREKWASLIPGKYTPKVKAFGYTQHTTQDDFETKEYKDRVLAKQFFHNPQAFEVLPERHEKSVTFGGKWEYQQTHGLPTVDRNELENGWGTVNPVSAEEVGIIEQALRDIGGRRPGNFIKSPTEAASLALNEPWWTPLQFGWEERNRQQLAFLDRSEQHLVDSTRLPFGGKIPPFGTSYGMGERIRDIAADYAKGFGLGPHGHAPGHNTSHFNTLGAEENRTRTLGYGNALVRLFNEKLGQKDIHTWALEACTNGAGAGGGQRNDVEANVRHVLLSVHAWREKGTAPSLVLSRLLETYLFDELAQFNHGLPEDVPRLVLPHQIEGGATLVVAGTSAASTGTIWADVDATAYGFDYAKQHHTGDADEAYVVGLVQRANAGDAVEAQYTAHLHGEPVQRFQLELAKIVGRGIPPQRLVGKTVNRGNIRSSGNVATYVSAKELAALLVKFQVASGDVSNAIRGLQNCPEQEALGADDFMVPVALVLAWAGPGTGGGRATSRTAAAAAGGGHAGQSRGGNVLNAVGAGSGGGGRSDSHHKLVTQVIHELALRDDGLAMDVQYTIRENKRNAVLRQEFFNAFLPVFNHDSKVVAATYDEYADGKYVPNVTVAIEAFVAFLGNVAAHPEKIPSTVPYFEAESGASGHAVQLNLLPPTRGPFRFESTLVEAVETNDLFQRYSIHDGPTRVSTTPFIAAGSKSFNYFTAAEDLVTVTTDNDRGLMTAVRQSAHYKAIAAHAQLQVLVNSPGGAGLVASFNRFFHRVAPMLGFYHKLLRDYSQNAGVLRQEAHNANSGLARVLESELSPALESEFRRNAERYWRNVLEGRGSEDAGMMAGGGGGGGNGRSVGGSSFRQQQQQRGGSAGRRGEGASSQRSTVGLVQRALGTKSSTPRRTDSSSNSSAQDAASAQAGASASTSTKSSSSSASSVSGLLNALNKKRAPGSGSSSGGRGGQAGGSRPRRGNGGTTPKK